jgi:chlorite dismutase
VTATERRRQFVKYTFYKLDRAWRLLPAEEKQCHKEQFAAAVEALGSEVLLRTFSLVGIRGDCDLMLWTVSADLDAIQQGLGRLNRTALAAYLDVPHAYLATTRRSIYVGHHHHEGQEGTRTQVRAGNARYLVVYPFVKTREWYALPKDERQRMMDQHIAVGHQYPHVRINTGYSYGLDDQEFVVAFDTDDPHEFLDLVFQLRESEASRYTLRDTPSFTCRAMPIHEILAELG